MTWEEAIEELERLLRHWDDLENGKRCFWGYDKEAVALALTALRPVSREQVEQVWRSYWDGFSNGYADDYEVYDEWQCRKCGFEVETDEPETLPQFCPACGAPMTDEAVQMVMERLEELKDGSETD